MLLWLPNRKSCFRSYKAWKNHYGSCLDFYKYFLHFKVLASNTIKKETRKNFKILLEINSVKYLPKFLAHINKHLGHAGTPTNVQNNFIKLLFGFGLFLHRDVTNNISCREDTFNPNILLQLFWTKLKYFVYYLCRFI